MKIVKNVKYVTSLVSQKTIDPAKVSFLFGFSFHNIMFLSYIKFERNLLLRKKHETVAYAFKKTQMKRNYPSISQNMLKCLLRLDVLRVLCSAMCLFLYGPICHGAIKLDLSTWFATCFL